MAGIRTDAKTVSAADGNDRTLAQAVQEVQSQLMPLRQGEFSANMDKVSVYVQSAANSKEPKTLTNFIRFARLNLDAALTRALEKLVYRPRLASKTDEHKKSVALQKTFDRLDDPARAMLEHYKSSSDPLNKYLVAGPWGHEYLRKRGIDIEEYDRELTTILGCEETAAGKIVLGYAELRRAIDRVEATAVQEP
ncbi:MAG: hypothetical protein LUQ59_05885 [Methanothrix sp.]|nr:hypothetical protein [Methanothrix sp.]